MNHCRHTLLVAIAAAIVFAVSWRTAIGQAPPPADPPKAEGEIQYVGPDTFLLLDREGRPQPVLGMKYEEFVAAWKKLQNLDRSSAEPRFTIDEFQITGRTLDDHAELDVELSIESHADGPIAVPLGMKDAILREQPTLEAGRSLVNYDPGAGGYVAWIDASRGKLQRMKLKLLRALVRDGNEASLELNLPRAMVSHLALTVPTPIVDAAVTGNGLLTKQPADGGGTRLTVDGPSDDFRLSWSTANGQRPELATVLSATGAIAITIDGHSIRSDARLTVRSYGGTFDRFRVRLPPGAQLVQERSSDVAAAAPGYRVVVDDTRRADDGSQTVTVELTQKQLGPVEIALSTEQPLGLPTAERAVELAGFSVLGAVRQFGDVAISVADDWQLRWENGPYVRQVERADLPAVLRDEQPNVAFQYDRQPWSMRVQIVARPMVVHVTPEYQLDLGVDEARLRVKLDYQVPGARAFEFHLQLAGWELTPDPIESNGLVDRDRVLVTRDGVLVLPLAQASSRRAEIACNLRRAIDRTATAVQLPLPVPEADTVAAADLVVSADPAIELLPDGPASRGLSATPITTDAPLHAAADGRQAFHYRTYMPGALFAAVRSVRPSDVSAEVDTQLAVGKQGLEASQEVTYRVKYQPLTSVAFDVPAGWSIVDERIEVASPSPGAEPSSVAVLTEPASPDGSKRVARATLAQPRLGQLHVRVAYQNREPADSLGLGEHAIALPLPVESRIVEQRVAVKAPPGESVTLDANANSNWKRQANAEEESSLVASTPNGAAILPLVMESASRNRPQATTVERIWLQTWQAGNTIQDRAAFKFHTTTTAVTVELPPPAVTHDIEVLVDGALAHVSMAQEGRLEIGVPADSVAGGQSHTLELRYRRPAPAGLLLRHTLTPPQLVGSSTLSEVYWQIVLPGDRHIVQTPSQLIPVDARQWLDAFWTHPATKSQAELEAWVGATGQLSPTSSQSTYLFSGLAPVASIEVLTAPRWLIVLVASGAVLVLASLWIYVPIVRRGWLVVALAALVVVLAVAYPEPAALVGQASVLGVVLAGVALALWNWTSARPLPRPAASAGSTNLRMRSSLRTDSYLSPSIGAVANVGSTSGTPTAPLVVSPEADR